MREIGQERADLDNGKGVGRFARVRALARNMMTALQEQSKTSIGKAVLT